MICTNKWDIYKLIVYHDPSFDHDISKVMTT